MLAMHYRFDLKDHDAVAQVRQRIGERGPVFDGLPGMAHKWFLLDAVKPCYALFYLWHEQSGIRSFIEGPFFKNLSETFGRPEVRLLLPTWISLPAEEPGEAALENGELKDAHVRALDARDGSVVSLRLSPGPGRRFELRYHARGA
jgi:hypothetical protein